jgi:WD40 repeat protein
MKTSKHTLRRDLCRSIALMVVLIIGVGPAGLPHSAFGEDTSAWSQAPYTEKPKLVAQLGHTAPISSVAFSPDGRFVLTGSWDTTAILWDVTTGKRIKQFWGHYMEVNAISFSPDGQYVLTGARDGSSNVRLWEAATGTEVRKYEVRISEVKTVAFSPDGGFILAGGGSGRAVMMDTATGREVRQFIGHEGWIESAAFSRDGRYILTGGYDSVRLWDTGTGKEVRRFPGSRDPVNAVAFSHSGYLVLTGGRDKIARLWDRETGKELRRYEGHGDKINSVAFSPDGRFVLTGSSDKTARLWNMETGKEQRRYEGNSWEIKSVAFSPEGLFVLTGGADARLWDTLTGREVQRFQGEDISVPSAKFSDDGRLVLAVTADGSPLLWDLASGQEVRRREKRAGESTWKAVISPDGRSVATGGREDAPVLWDAETGEEKNTLMKRGAVLVLAFSPDSRLLLEGGHDKRVRLWDVKTGNKIRQFEGHSGIVTSGVFSPDGRFVLTGSSDGTACLWRTETGKELKRFAGHSHELTSVALSGEYVLTASVDGTARLWDVNTARVLRQFKGHLGPINSATFSPDHRFVITGGSDGTARLWDAQTGQEVFQLKGHARAVSSAVFSPNGRFVLTGSEDGSARLWDMVTGLEAQRFEGNEGIITSVDFSPDGRFVLTGSRDGNAQTWNVETGKPLPPSFRGEFRAGGGFVFSPDGRFRLVAGEFAREAELVDEEGKVVRSFKGHTSYIISKTFSPDSRLVLTCSADSTTRLWEVSTGREFASLISFLDGSWAVVAPDGRFDSNDLENIKGLHWVMPDDPMRPLPVEIFMRDYYEPKLLPRLLAGEEFRPVRPLAELNRFQPKVEIKDVRVEDGKAGTVAVTVEVEAASGTLERDGKKVPMKTGVYDLRLFRDGQLVTQMPSPAYEPSGIGTSWEEELRQWRGVHKIIDFETGKKTIIFRGMQLPRRAGLKEVEFSAYAFNEDRVKSATARTRITIPKGLPPRQGRAYVVAVGVNAYESSDWDLRYAAKDAQYFLDVVNPLLEKTRNYAEVVPVRLISDWTVGPSGQRKITINDATKTKFKTVLDLLAGRKVKPGLRSTIPNAERLIPVQPEDLVLIAFSSHGYADTAGVFYLFPYDIGSQAGRKVGPELLRRAISSDELSLWMQEIDAGEMVMIIDACHSAASVEGTGFKPGPMGARGLGQLAYDKGMRILASTRADDVAWESPLTKQGLLSYALVQNGLVEKQADFDPQDRKILFSEWLKYGVKRVPELYSEVRSGQVSGAEEKAAKLTAYRGGVEVDHDEIAEAQADVQQPSLFDFRRAVRYEPLITRFVE